MKVCNQEKNLCSPVVKECNLKKSIGRGLDLSDLRTDN